MRKEHLLVGLVAGLVLCGGATALAATCKIASFTYTCDFVCTPNCNFSVGVCDGNGDGRCVLCGNASANTITGTSGNDVICGGGNDDTLNGGAGDDIIDGGARHDLIFGGIGDDELYGDAGNDYIEGNGGNDTVNGGANDDIIRTGTDFNDPSTHSGNLCGGDGNDTITGFGYGHQCVDGGPGTDGCVYVAPIAAPGNKQAGSFRHCETEQADANSQTFLLSNEPPCGCTGEL